MLKPNRRTELIGGKRYKYPCKCAQHSLDCVTPEMWDAAAYDSCWQGEHCKCCRNDSQCCWCEGGIDELLWT